MVAQTPTDGALERYVYPTATLRAWIELLVGVWFSAYVEAEVLYELKDTAYILVLPLRCSSCILTSRRSTSACASLPIRRIASRIALMSSWKVKHAVLFAVMLIIEAQFPANLTPISARFFLKPFTNVALSH